MIPDGRATLVWSDGSGRQFSATFSITQVSIESSTGLFGTPTSRISIEGVLMDGTINVQPVHSDVPTFNTPEEADRWLDEQERAG